MKLKKGFTLVELLVSIAIIGILVTIVVIAVNPQRIMQDTADTKTRTELNQVKTSLQLYFNDNNRYPDTTEFGTVGTTPFIPTYMRPLPIIPTIDYDASGTNYDALIDVENNTDVDDESRTKCTSDGDLTGAADSGMYMICPD